MTNVAALQEPSTAAPLTITLPAIAEGERYLGLILKDDGTPDYHVVLLPGETSGTWQQCLTWAKDQGGDLPSRREQSLAYTNARASFESDWYWSGEEYAGVAGYAWSQYFGYGTQGYDHKDGKGLARAVRRVPL